MEEGSIGLHDAPVLASNPSPNQARSWSTAQTLRAKTHWVARMLTQAGTSRPSKEARIREGMIGWMWVAEGIPGGR